MPEISAYVNVDVEVDIDEFLSSCTEREIQKLIDYLIEDGYIKNNKNNNPKLKNLIELEWEQTIYNLLEKRLSISNEDEETIKKISKKY